MSEVWMRYPAGGGERLLALALADHASDDGTRVYPSVAELARKTVQSQRTVQRQLAAMVESGWLVLERRSSGRPGDTNRYHISPVWLAGGDLPAVDAKAATGDKLSPVKPAESEALVCGKSCGYVVDKVIHTGDKKGGTGDTAVSPEPSIEPNTNTPPPPADAGGFIQKENQSPKTKHPADQSGGARMPRAKVPWRWRESRQGVEAMGHSLGLGGWDAEAFNAGRGEQWPAYRGRVLRAFEQAEAAGTLPVLQAPRGRAMQAGQGMGAGS